MRAARIFSRSNAITCMRVFSRSRESTGISTVSTVAKAAIAASSVTMIAGLISDMNWSSMALASLEASSAMPPRNRCRQRSSAASILEVDHLPHDEDAAHTHDRSTHEQELAEARGPQQRDVGGRGDVDEDHDDERQRAEHGGFRLGLRRACAGLGPHRAGVAAQ